jgi:hypothetical protein
VCTATELVRSMRVGTDVHRHFRGPHYWHRHHRHHRWCLNSQAQASYSMPLKAMPTGGAENGTICAATIRCGGQRWVSSVWQLAHRGPGAPSKIIIVAVSGSRIAVSKGQASLGANGRRREQGRVIGGAQNHRGHRAFVGLRHFAVLRGNFGAITCSFDGTGLRHHHRDEALGLAHRGAARD